MLFTDRQRGTLLGLSVGDALGAAVEFESPGTFPAVAGYRGGGPHGLSPGEWTDDTSMALALADSIANFGWDLDDQAQRYTLGNLREVYFYPDQLVGHSERRYHPGE